MARWACSTSSCHTPWNCEKCNIFPLKGSTVKQGLPCTVLQEAGWSEPSLSSPPCPQHTHTHNTQSHSQTRCYLFLIFLTTSCSSPRSSPAICPLFRSCLTVHSFPCAPLTWTVKKLEPQILRSAVCPDGCRCLVLSPRSFFCLIIHSCLSRLPVPRCCRRNCSISPLHAHTAAFPSLPGSPYPWEEGQLAFLLDQMFHPRVLRDYTEEVTPLAERSKLQGPVCRACRVIQGLINSLVSLSAKAVSLFPQNLSAVNWPRSLFVYSYQHETLLSLDFPLQGEIGPDRRPPVASLLISYNLYSCP